MIVEVFVPPKVIMVFVWSLPFPQVKLLWQQFCHSGKRDLGNETLNERNKQHFMTGSNLRLAPASPCNKRLGVSKHKRLSTSESTTLRCIYMTFTFCTAPQTFGTRASSFRHGPLYLHGKLCSSFFNVGTLKLLSPRTYMTAVHIWFADSRVQ